MDTAPERGADSDDTHRGNGSVAGIARWDTSGKVIVRISSFTTLRIGSYDRLEVATAPEVSA